MGFGKDGGELGERPFHALSGFLLYKGWVIFFFFIHQALTVLLMMEMHKAHKRRMRLKNRGNGHRVQDMKAKYGVTTSNQYVTTVINCSFRRVFLAPAIINNCVTYHNNMSHYYFTFFTLNPSFYHLPLLPPLPTLHLFSAEAPNRREQRDSEFVGSQSNQRPPHLRRHSLSSHGAPSR